ncbi:MAG TPA: hypothetical protein VFQ12_05160, partial [Thermoleophilaceae bacterium]|nr:hypothetical protein [Thermoleophilaceae bacterium]
MPVRPYQPACARGLLAVPALLCALIAAIAIPAAAEARPLDADRDGLSNRLEKHRFHTHPRKADTDGDGLRDRYELRRSRTSPRRKDTDRDALSDGFEVNGSKTSPRRADTDRDGLSDGYELKRSKSSPRRKDTDGDGLSDGYEVRRSKTSPRNADGDGDGLRDGVEVFFGLDPRRAPDEGLDDPPTPPDLPDPLDPPTPPDSSAPNTSITGGPSGTVATRSASFSFSSSESGSAFQCRLDSGSWSACSPPKAFSNLGEGTHTFAVRARDQAGNTDGSPAQRTWTIDLPAPPPPDVIPPSTSIIGGPTGTTSSASATFTFSSSESGSTFQCRLDSGAWNGCTSPKGVSGLGEGSHTFAVRASDGAG